MSTWLTLEESGNNAETYSIGGVCYLWHKSEDRGSDVLVVYRKRAYPIGISTNRFHGLKAEQGVLEKINNCACMDFNLS